VIVTETEIGIVTETEIVIATEDGLDLDRDRAIAAEKETVTGATDRGAALPPATSAAVMIGRTIATALNAREWMKAAHPQIDKTRCNKCLHFRNTLLYFSHFG
jgi:hypothetical protein